MIKYYEISYQGEPQFDLIEASDPMEAVQIALNIYQEELWNANTIHDLPDKTVIDSIHLDDPYVVENLSENSHIVQYYNNMAGSYYDQEMEERQDPNYGDDGSLSIGERVGNLNLI